MTEEDKEIDIDDDGMRELAIMLNNFMGDLSKAIAGMVADMATLAVYVSNGLNESARKMISEIDFDAIAADLRERGKYERRVAYHRRLSERNRLHPKRKPRR